jgi:hypothetical protein
MKTEKKWVVTRTTIETFEVWGATSADACINAGKMIRPHTVEYKTKTKRVHENKL